MAKEMNNKYPRIYSLSTVGVRQHNNADYLLHHTRTDFTGDNGLGKSIIADLMQLIFVPKRDMWKPGTEGVGKNDRRIEGIPLNKDYVTHAYTFVNIERYQGHFVTIGAYIPKNSRVPVRPFIVQKGDDFESKTLISFNEPLKASDFVNETKQVLDLKELKDRLLHKYDVHLKDFINHDEIQLYYEMLYRNQLIPIDLTKENNLKTYAKILQSFARAKTLDINNSRSLQNFLFEDNDIIRQIFEEQKDQLISYIRQYNKNRRLIGDLEIKQTKLSNLKSLHERYLISKTEYLKADAVVASLAFLDAQNITEDNEIRLNTAITSYKKSQEEVKMKSGTILRLYQELIGTSKVLKDKLEDTLPNLTDDKIEIKRMEANKLWGLVNQLEKFAPIFKKYRNIKAIQKKLADQSLVREQKKKLDSLKGMSTYKEFEKSEWVRNYGEAYKIYQQKLIDLPQAITALKNILELYQSNTGSDTFLHWAIDQKKALTIGQETVLMHLKDIMLSKPKKNEAGYTYTNNPDILVNNFEETKDGVWLLLGELREFVPFVEKQKFNNAKSLKSSIQKDSDDIKSQIEIAQNEFETITTLNRELTEIGFNAEALEAFNNRNAIESYEFDESLNESVIPIIENNIEILNNFDTLSEQYKTANDEATSLTRLQTGLRIDLDNVNKNLIAYTTYVEGNYKDAKKTNKEAETKLHEKNIAELKTLQSEIAAQAEGLIAGKENAERTIISNEGVIESSKERKKQLVTEIEKLAKVFEEKRKALESETAFKFEDILAESNSFSEKVLKRFEGEYFESRRNYEQEFTRIAQSFEETKDQKNQELENDRFNFHTLVRILCGKLALEGMAPELVKLNEEIKKFGDLQVAIIINVFSQVEKQYNNLRRLVTELNFFFQENKISSGYSFRIDFNDRKDINIDWISKMRERAKVQRFGADLFSDIQGIETSDSSPDKLIISIAQAFSQARSCELEDLLNPKYYFDLKVGLFDDKNNKYSGSGGQAYTALALLCIGRLSVIQREKDRPGIKFIIIEELSNIDDTNFGLFPQIAEQFGYQLLTMTPKPFGTYSEDNWFLHMLVRGKDKDINYQPMSFFKTRNTKKLLRDYAVEVETEKKASKNSESTDIINN
jgi:exonuclease SbcC